MATTVILNAQEILLLDRQDPAAERDGGWQSLIVGLQRKLDRATGERILDATDRERIPRYAFDYGNGGWEGHLRGVCGRHLGAQLGHKS